MSATNQMKHQAGRHLAVAEALLRGYEAVLSGPQTFIEVNGQTAQVQVAAQGSWQVADVEAYLEGSISRVVLVDVSGESPVFYVLPGDELRDLVRRHHEEFMARVGGRRPRNPSSKHTRIDPALVQRWRDEWDLFK